MDLASLKGCVKLWKARDIREGKGRRFIERINMDIQYPLWLNMELWIEYKKMRKKLKKPLTDFAEKLMLDDLDKLCTQGEDHEEVIKQSIKLSYQGLFPVRKVEKSGNDWEALIRGEG